MSASAESGKVPKSTPKILLDTPTMSPALDYDKLGRGLATIISQSEPRFAVGIFGGWGSGKTTLMTAIKAALPKRGVVVVDFNAWRFEREPQLLLPLLDTIRDELVRWSESRGTETREKVRSIATRIGRVVRALAVGLSGQVGLPGAATVSYDLGAAINAFSSPVEPEHAQSLYVAAFRELERAFGEFSSGGETRVVVFVDDLDRCLPRSALEVLESIKLFFDLPGFIFVVGLDEDVVERAIRAKLAADDVNIAAVEAAQAAAPSIAASQRLGREYVKKIFQVPCSLPAVLPQQLDELLRSMYKEAGLDSAQLDDLQKRVRPYLIHIAKERQVNPREVKRFVNAYTLQTLVRPKLNRDTILALQTLAFRNEWEDLYDVIHTDSGLFLDALRRYRTGDDSAFEDLSQDLKVLPSSLSAYLRSPLAEPLMSGDSLDEYISSPQSTRGTRDWILDALKQIGELRTMVHGAMTAESISREELQRISDYAAAVTEEIRRLSSGSAGSGEVLSGLSSVLTQIYDLAIALPSVKEPGITFGTDKPGPVSPSALAGLERAIEQAHTELRHLRRSSILQP